MVLHIVLQNVVFCLILPLETTVPNFLKRPDPDPQLGLKQLREAAKFS
jgi:hypothetical protein